MPSPANPHRSSVRLDSAKSTPTKNKPLDLGPQLGPYDTNSVRAKIRKWQQQGGGVITANDPCCDDEDETPTKPKSNPGKENVGSKGSSSRGTPGSGVRPRSSSTPRKRVISDEHWRINRSTAKTTTPKRPPPKKISVYTSNEELLARQGGTKKDVKRDDKTKPSPSPRSAGKFGASHVSPLSNREQRKVRSPRNADNEKGTSHSKTSSSASRSLGADGHQTNEELESSETKMRRTTPPPEVEWEASEADFSELSRRRARGVPYKQRGPVKPPKGGIFAHVLDESRKVFVKPEPPKPPKPVATPYRPAKIEAWLSNTLDPFAEDAEPSVEVPAPLNPKPTKSGQSSRRNTVHEVIDSNSRSDDDSRGKGSRARRMSDKGNSPITKSEHSSDEKRESREQAKKPPSPPSVKRSDTVKSNNQSNEVKENAAASHEANHESSDMENILSDGSEVSGTNPPVPLGLKRPFPSTGVHRLSTIVSVETLSSLGREPPQVPQSDGPSERREPVTINQPAGEDAEERDQFDADSLPGVSSKLKRRLTTHEDLMTVLSAPRSQTRSIRSARSVRTNKSRLTATNIGDLLQELSTDEAKYMRELKTLVGGVIPVLLTCVLSKSDSAIAAGLFRPSMDPKDDVNFTKPIVDMGVTLERLKALHKRIPQDNVESLLHWAQGAQRVYREYLRAWRLGFRDVIVNLAPQEEGKDTSNSDTKSLDEGMARDENGDVVGSDGEKVDVAYLLKRPLVRLKYLAKTLKGISILQPSLKAEEIAVAYQDIVTEARRRAREERARLEDESAASVDATRARDPMTMGVMTDVIVDRTRRVRARDFFNLSLYHSTGQVVDCRAELLLRDNLPENGPGGDLLICEIDHMDRWLLFPPIELGCVSARRGDTKGELVVMLRSAPGQETNWRELLSLQIDEEGIAHEWAQMLPADPVPPAICRSPSFIDRAKQRQRAQSTSKDGILSQKTPASTSDVDIPMGEKKTVLSSAGHSLAPDAQASEPSSVVDSSLATESKTSSLHTAITRDSDYTQGSLETPIKLSGPPLPSVMSSQSPNDGKTPTLKRTKAKRISRLGEPSPQANAAQNHASPATPDTENAPPTTGGRFYNEAKHHEWTSTPTPRKPPKEQQHVAMPVASDPYNRRPPRVSCVPSMELPSIPKLRTGGSPCPSLGSPSDASDEDDEFLDDPGNPLDAGEAPAPPPHRTPSSANHGYLDVPTIGSSGGRLKRHGSSPLKHEYEPSTASDSYCSDTSTVRHYSLDDSSSFSSSYYTETDSEYETGSDSDDDTRGASKPKPELENSSILPSVSSSSLTPTKSESQAAYRAVPTQPSKASRALASVFAWSDTGSWSSLSPEECIIIISPGLIEVYEANDSALPSDKDGTGSRGQPLVALELTPLVPMRRGTAIDISVRSPPTQRSKIISSNNIMFRSRNTEECDALYSLINQARISNPTYIALQNARGPFADQPSTFDSSDNKTGGFFGWPRRRRSYRASPNAPRSSADVSESSVGTMSSAFSALKRFGAGSKMFSIARSTVTSKTGDKGESSYSSSSPTSGIGRIAAAIRGADGIGLSNAKIRLYARESNAKWRDMGAARLTIMPASSSSDSRHGDISFGRNTHSADGPDSGSPSGSGASSPRPESESTKRILIRGKTRGEVLLDVCLGESSFERVARTGIAVSVWEENEGGAPAKQQGGVTVGAYKIYMIQMKSEAEAAYTFGLVGKLRY